MTQYLILHKVRGEPAFDVAEKISDMSRDEDWWIIPTSGHRAYPFMSWNLEDLMDTSDINSAGNHPRPATFDHMLPADWQDHYSVNDRKHTIVLSEVVTDKAKAKLTLTLEDLGL